MGSILIQPTQFNPLTGVLPSAQGLYPPYMTPSALTQFAAKRISGKLYKWLIRNAQ